VCSLSNRRELNGTTGLFNFNGCSTENEIILINRRPDISPRHSVHSKYIQSCRVSREVTYS